MDRPHRQPTLTREVVHGPSSLLQPRLPQAMLLFTATLSGDSRLQRSPSLVHQGLLPQHRPLHPPLHLRLRQLLHQHRRSPSLRLEAELLLKHPNSPHQNQRQPTMHKLQVPGARLLVAAEPRLDGVDGVALLRALLLEGGVLQATPRLRPLPFQSRRRTLILMPCSRSSTRTT